MSKQGLIEFARHVHVYNYLRHNALYHAVETLCDGEARRAFAERVERLRAFIGCERFLAFDVGANVGQFTGPLLKLGARVIAVEPDEDAAEILNVRFWGRRVVVEPCAVSDAPGTATFYRQHPGSQRNTLVAQEIEEVGGARHTVEVKLCTLQQLIERHGKPHFLKIDVEGNEPAVLRGLTTPLARVMFECNAPHGCTQGAACVRRLIELSRAYEFAIATAGTVCPAHWADGPSLLSRVDGLMEPVDIFARLP